nr:MAG: hypothetical protein [Halyomorpha halys reo-like associated virus 1]
MSSSSRSSSIALGQSGVNSSHLINKVNTIIKSNPIDHFLDLVEGRNDEFKSRFSETPRGSFDCLDSAKRDPPVMAKSVGSNPAEYRSDAAYSSPKPQRPDEGEAKEAKESKICEDSSKCHNGWSGRGDSDAKESNENHTRRSVITDNILTCYKLIRVDTFVRAWLRPDELKKLLDVLSSHNIIMQIRLRSVIDIIVSFLPCWMRDDLSTVLFIRTCFKNDLGIHNCNSDLEDYSISHLMNQVE